MYLWNFIEKEEVSLEGENYATILKYRYYYQV